MLMTRTSPQRDDPRVPQQPHVLGSPSELACLVCGHHALSQPQSIELGKREPERLFCLLCGAHRMLP